MALPLGYNVRSLLLRRWTNAFSAGGIALVVAATMLLAALVGGLQHILVAAGEADNLVIMRKGATNDGSSQVPRDAALAIRAMAGIARGANGQPLASAEIVNQPFMRTPAGGRENVLVRGVEPVAFDVHRSVRLVRGRIMQPKLGEIVVGADASRRYGAPLGSTIHFGRRDWKVVGIFDSGGTAFDSEIWADVSDVQDDTRRDGYSGMRITVAPGADGRTLIRRIESDGRFTLQAKPELAYYGEQAETASSLYVLVLTLAVIMATGATFGALNTMYAAVANRTAEIGTLRALGFGRGAILLSFLTESLILSMVGMIAGVALAALAMFAVNTLLSGVAFSMMTFSVATVLLRPSAGGALMGLAFALAIGIFGGIGPAWRAAHLRVTDALRRA
ncbi:MAG TPA: ABC transporter permease [Candidatus Binatia bacterium]|jgi:ABC-type lipoprotein release transport system permease subunit|nr:ABC transporter permease [Candidatus Binatia bacterium]